MTIGDFTNPSIYAIPQKDDGAVLPRIANSFRQYYKWEKSASPTDTCFKMLFGIQCIDKDALDAIEKRVYEILTAAQGVDKSTELVRQLDIDCLIDRIGFGNVFTLLVSASEVTAQYVYDFKTANRGQVNDVMYLFSALVATLQKQNAGAWKEQIDQMRVTKKMPLFDKAAVKPGFYELPAVNADDQDAGWYPDDDHGGMGVVEDDGDGPPRVSRHERSRCKKISLLAAGILAAAGVGGFLLHSAHDKISPEQAISQSPIDIITPYTIVSVISNQDFNVLAESLDAPKAIPDEQVDITDAVAEVSLPSPENIIPLPTCLVQPFSLDNFTKQFLAADKAAGTPPSSESSAWISGGALLGAISLLACCLKGRIKVKCMPVVDWQVGACDCLVPERESHEDHLDHVLNTPSADSSHSVAVVDHAAPPLAAKPEKRVDEVKVSTLDASKEVTEKVAQTYARVSPSAISPPSSPANQDSSLFGRFFGAVGEHLDYLGTIEGFRLGPPHDGGLLSYRPFDSYEGGLED